VYKNNKIGELILYKRGAVNVPTVLQSLHGVQVRAAYIMSYNSYFSTAFSVNKLFFNLSEATTTSFVWLFYSL
jgi:hypothetical protein